VATTMAEALHNAGVINDDDYLSTVKQMERVDRLKTAKMAAMRKATIQEGIVKKLAMRRQNSKLEAAQEKLHLLESQAIKITSQHARAVRQLQEQWLPDEKYA
jgi:hypothetical protein